MSIINPLDQNSFPQKPALDLMPKRLGTILLEADLVSVAQIQVALQDQAYRPDLLLGEILATRGWINPETADFFAQHWLRILQHKQQLSKPLGWYLKEAALLKDKDIQLILNEQKSTGIRFGTVAVLQGILKSTTLDFFLMYLFPQEFDVSPFRDMYRSKGRRKFSFDTLQLESFGNQTNSLIEESDDEDFEIKWID